MSDQLLVSPRRSPSAQRPSPRPERSPSAPAGDGGELSRLGALLARVARQLTRNTRKVRLLAHRQQRLFKLVRRAVRLRSAAAEAGAAAAVEHIVMHVRVLFDVGEAYLAAPVYDKRPLPPNEGAWELEPQRSVYPCLRVRKASAAGAFIAAHSVVASDVLRVTARQDLTPRASKRACLRSTYYFDETLPGYEVRRPRRPRRKAVDITFDDAVLVETGASLALVYDAALVAFPTAQGAPAIVDKALYARNRGLLLPNDEETPRRCLERLGAPPGALDFAEAAVALGPLATARLATDPRFQAMLATPRSAATNAEVRLALDRARAWTPDAELLPPRQRMAGNAKSHAFNDSALPLLVWPDPAVRPPPEPEDLLLRDAPTGSYVCSRGMVFVRFGGVPPSVRVVGHTSRHVYHEGADQRAPRDTRWAWVSPVLSMMDGIANRLATVAFEGDTAWTDADLRRAMGVAERVVFAFRNPRGATAEALYARLRALKEAPRT